MLCVFPIENSDEQRLPAYSGATVPDLHRLPVADVPLRLARQSGKPSARSLTVEAVVVETGDAASALLACV